MKCNGKDCKEPPAYNITYDCGPDPDQELTLCKKHYESNEAFKQYIKKIEAV